MPAIEGMTAERIHNCIFLMLSNLTNNFKFQIPDFNFWHLPILTFAFRLSPFALRLMPYALCLTPFALRLMPYALRLTPYALRLTPYALRLTPYALRLTPYALRLTPYFPFPHCLITLLKGNMVLGFFDSNIPSLTAFTSSMV